MNEGAEMFDIVASVFATSDIHCGIAWVSWVAAVIIGPIMAFSVTDGAGIRCPIALLRGVHRVFLVMLAVALAYLGADTIAQRDVTAGPVFLVLVTLLLSTVVSGVRHWLGLPEPTAANNWGAFLRAVRSFMQRPSFRPAPIPTKR